MVKNYVSRLFAFAQRLVRMDLKYILSGGAFLGAAQVFGALVAFALTVAFANLLPPDTYGTYRYLLAAYGLFAIAALPGIDTAVLRAVSRDEAGSVAAGTKLKLKWSLLGTLLSLIYASYNFYIGEEILGYASIILAVALPLLETTSLYSSYFNGKKQYQRWSYWDIATQLISAVVLVFTMLFSKNVLVLVAAYFGTHGLIRLVAYLSIKKEISTKEIYDSHELHTYGKSVTVFQAMGRIVSSVDQIILFHFLGPVQVAIYSIATAIPNRMQSLFRISGTLAFPKFAYTSAAIITATLPRKMILFGISILGVCLVYVFCAPFLFHYLFPQYNSSLVYSQVVVFFTLSAITYPFSSYLFAHKKLKDNYILAVGSFFSKIFCLVLFVPNYGIWGAIIGILASAASTLLLTTLILYRR